MKLPISTLALTLLCAALPSQAADVAPAAKPAKATAASAPTAKAVTKTGTAVPAAGGNGGSVGGDGSNLGTQVGPKKPKCPDPTVACVPEKVIAK